VSTSVLKTLQIFLKAIAGVGALNNILKDI
jgi:hypothetical protein